MLKVAMLLQNAAEIVKLLKMIKSLEFFENTTSFKIALGCKRNSQIPQSVQNLVLCMKKCFPKKIMSFLKIAKGSNFAVEWD